MSDKKTPGLLCSTVASLQYSQQAARDPYPRSHDFNPHTHTLFLPFILIFSSHLYLRLPGGPFHSRFPTKMLYAFLTSHACYMPRLFMLFNAILIILAKSINYGTPYYATFSRYLSLRRSQVQILTQRPVF
jgi:hypothetical protein